MWNTFALYRLAEETRNIIRYRLRPNLANTQLPPILFGDNGNQEEIDITLGALEQIDRSVREPVCIANEDERPLSARGGDDQAVAHA